MKTLQEKKEESKNTLEMLEKGVKEVFTSNKFREYLDTMSKFHNYSVKNILWLQIQNPNSSRVAGMKTWNKVGRKVNKGEKSLKVLAPQKHKKLVEMDKLDPKTGKQCLDKNGNQVREKQTVEWISYRAVPVFDIAQTNGKELPTLIEELQGNVNNYQYMKASLIEVAKVPVTFENIKDSKGYYHLTENRIAVKDGMSEQHTIKTLVHEITHSRLHSIDKQKNIKDITENNTKEIEAESVAYVVSNHFGINTSEYSFGYVASWSNGKELKELEKSLGNIQKEANSLISEIEEKLEEKLSKDKVIEKDAIKEAEPIKSIENKQKIIETPYVEIAFSEVSDKKYFNAGDKIPFEKANKMFRNAEQEVREKKEEYKEKGEYYPYSKTKFELHIEKDIKTTMRYDIGDGFANDLKDFCNKELTEKGKKLLKVSIEKKVKTKEIELER